MNADEQAGKFHAVPAACSVWLIEDDAAVRAAVEFALSVEGYRVEPFQRGADATAAASAGQSCCRLILDYLLPDTDGLRLLKSLRALGVTATVIIVTTNPSLSLRDQAKAAGATIVEKPLMRDALLTAMNRIGCGCGGAPV